ncbi:MAG: Spo0E family sporulation regulatory protein-aspartic acid phosphatase [Lachnospiraceae bacterium]|nr:Spo0E family sporulation regulatory protein-aspartic acid phosphatase [Lachnospiraceae bacterium]
MPDRAELRDQAGALRERIEEEREKLNRLVGKSGRAEETYRQSLILDGLIARYMEENVGIAPTKKE